jgi:hypothetical protein
MKRDKCNKSSTEQVIEYSQQQKKELTREAGKNGWLGSSEREFVSARLSDARYRQASAIYSESSSYSIGPQYTAREIMAFLPLSTGGFW